MVVRQAASKRQVSEKSGVVDGQPRASETQNPMRSYSDSPHTKPSYVTEPLRPLAFERAQKTSPCQPPQATTYMAGQPAHRLAPQIIGGRRMLHRTTSRKTPLAAASGRGRYCIPSATPPIYACTAHTKQPPTQENLAVPTSGHGTFARQPHQALQAVSPETASRTDAPRSPEHVERRRPLLRKAAGPAASRATGDTPRPPDLPIGPLWGQSALSSWCSRLRAWPAYGFARHHPN